MAEEVVAPEIAVEAVAEASPVSTDHKRKLEELETEETPTETPAESIPPPSDLPREESEVKPDEDENENSVPDAKRPRLDDESERSVVENGHEVQKPDESAMDNAPNTTVEKVQADNTQQVIAEDIQTVTVGEAAVENSEAGNEQTVSEENLQPSFAINSSGTDLQQNIDGSAPQQTEFSDAPQQSTASVPGQADDSSAQQQSSAIPEQFDVYSAQQQHETDMQTSSRKMEIPNNKVGVLIGKAGDTIKLLQFNSGAKIQITRDTEADPSSTTRPVELIGTFEQIDKAEKLIKDVIAEADAGGSPSLVARGFGNVHVSGGAEQIQIQVPNEKVGLIIGKGGENIKNLQTKSGARIQLIPQHLPEGDHSRERTVRVTGDKRQIEIASEMIKEVMNQPVRHSSRSGGYNQHNYRPRGPTGPTQWGPRGPSSAQGTGYDYQQRGMYPSQNPQYPPQNYGGYQQQQPTQRNNYNAGWEQRPAGPVQTPVQGGGYDYYAQGGHAADAPVTVSSNSVPPTAVGAPSSQVNYYGQPQGSEYGQPTTYPQQAPNQQSYGPGYEDPRYGNQVAAQPGYGGHGNAQTGAYPQQVSNQHGYAQQQYSKQPTYGMQPQGPAQQAYGPPRTGQPGDAQYQNSTQSYGPNVQSQQPYPYASSGPAQQAYPYGSAPPANDGYNQPQNTGPTAAYPQQGGHPVQGYGQPGGQPAPVYAQGGQAAVYGQYPSQQGYMEQPVQNSGNYGYQAPADTGYGSAPAAAYGAAPNVQTNYVQPTSTQPGYEQQAPQSGAYASAPGGAPVGYAKNVSPQPVYAQYDSTQMYAGQHQ